VIELATDPAAPVLVTGSAGRLGRAAVTALVEAGVTVRGFDRLPSPGLPDAAIAELTDVDAVRKAVAGCRAVVHLAAAPDDANYPRKPAPDDGDNFLSQLVPGNLVGLYNVMEAARVHGVPRVILASSGQVMDGHFDAGNLPITVTMPTRPRYLYAATKVFMEAVGHAYARCHGLNVLVVRLGWCPRDLGHVAEIAADPDCQDVFLSPTDAGSFFERAVNAPWVGEHTVYVTSRPTHRLCYDLRPTTKLLGWEPRETWPTGAEAF
jgi:uronate dehydrogenase